MKNTGRRLIAIMMLSSAGLTPALSVQAAGETELDAGLEAAREYRYEIAFKHFCNAAEQGNLDAQRNAGLMALYGERLYRAEVRRNRPEAIKWLGRAASEGNPTSVAILRLPPR